MKKKKRLRLLIPGLISLALTSIAMLGFSTWIINGSISDSSDSVSVNVSYVDDRTAIINILDKDSKTDYSLNFDNNKIAEGSSRPNSYVENQGEEDLSFTIVFEITSNTYTLPGNFDITIAPDDASQKFYTSTVGSYINASCINGSYTFTMPSISETSTPIIGKERKPSIDTTATYSNISTSVTYDTAGTDAPKKAQVVMTYTFGWGEAFNYKNPGDSTQSYEKLIANLNAFVAAMNTRPQIQLTVTPEFTGTPITSS